MPRRKGVPKRPRSAYVLFKNAQRKDKAEEFKTMSASEFAAFTRKNWENAEKHVREIYENLSKYDKLRYDTDIQEVFKKPKKKKRLPNAYSLYVKDNVKTFMKEHEITLADACKQLATIWLNMPDSEKLPYFRRHKKLKANAKRRVFMQMTGQLEEDGRSQTDHRR